MPLNGMLVMSLHDFTVHTQCVKSCSAGLFLVIFLVSISAEHFEINPVDQIMDMKNEL